MKVLRKHTPRKKKFARENQMPFMNFSFQRNYEKVLWKGQGCVANRFLKNKSLENRMLYSGLQKAFLYWGWRGASKNFEQKFWPPWLADGEKLKKKLAKKPQRVQKKQNLDQNINDSKPHIGIFFSENTIAGIYNFRPQWTSSELLFYFIFFTRKPQSQQKLARMITHFIIQFRSKNLTHFTNLNSLDIKTICYRNTAKNLSHFTNVPAKMCLFCVRKIFAMRHYLTPKNCILEALWKQMFLYISLRKFYLVGGGWIFSLTLLAVWAS